MNERMNKRGMSLVELMVVIGILGILFTAVYMFFTKGTEQFHFARRQNELATSGRLALEALSDEIRWAGYMPIGGWTEDNWHPVQLGTETTFQFYADLDGNGQLTDTDYRNIFRDAYDAVRITDNGSMSRVAGTGIVALQFNYFDAQGNLLSKPLDANDRDAVRHIGIKITLQDTFMGDVYQTVMQTVVTPRNLGVRHDFDPMFFLPPTTPGNIVVNVADSFSIPSPTLDEDSLISYLVDWGHKVEIISDQEIATFAFDTATVDLFILRNKPMGNHFADSMAIMAIELPVIALDPEDAAHIFGMGYGPSSVSSALCPMYKVIPDHDIHYNVNPDSLDFNVYDGDNPFAVVTLLDSLAIGTKLVTQFDGTGTDSISGASVIHEAYTPGRRIHYGAPSFKDYSTVGKMYLYNVINWGMGDYGGTPPLGEEIVLETFEGDLPGEAQVVLWEDDLEGGMMLPDSIPIYTDFIPGGTPEMAWTNISTGLGEITRLGDNTLQTHRTASGSWDRNITATSVDLSGYSALSDDLYIRVDTWRGTSETINAEDGVFLFSSSGGITELVSEDFEDLLLANGDVEFWGDLYGRNRVHSPGWNNGTRFATLDTRVDGNYARVRMIVEVDTSTLSDGTPITVYYRMSDHADESHPYNSGTKAGDYIAWSTGNGIDDPVYNVVNLAPGSKPNGAWDTYEYTFTPTGAMPATVYVVFSQYDDQMATSATSNDGISFDDLYIVADNTVLDLDRIGVPSSSEDWQTLAIDLDDQATVYGVPFSADFGIALSQYGLGPWSNYGMRWRNFELGMIEYYYAVPGWSNGSVGGATNDWLLESIFGDHKWTLHANDPSYYSNNSHCWLQTPEFTIPTGATDAQLSFDHEYHFENGHDYGWMEISTNGGSTWQPLDCTFYNSTHGGHGAFTGSQLPTAVQVDLSGYAANTVSIRFMFYSDISIVRSGWILDNFSATATVSGLAIDAIGFKPETPGGSWVFDSVDIWLGGVSADEFTGSGEWDKSSLTYAGTYTVPADGLSEWITINLNETFVLATGTNLLVKMEMSQASPVSGFQWISEASTSMTRWAVSASGDPTTLTVGSTKPAFMVSTLNHGNRYVFESGATTSDVMPLAFNSLFGDFEGIYTLDELGFSGDVSWVSGGTNNDWEVGAPVFTPDVDPNLLPRHQNSIAGNDLTDDGYYPPMAWSWIRSSAYDLSEAAVYDSVSLGYDRCLRRSSNDFARIQMAFTDTETPPTDESDWITVKLCDYDDIEWTMEVVPLTQYFQDAISNGRNYYFIRFLLDSGVFGEKGGWNIDNVGFYGRNGI